MDRRHRRDQISSSGVGNRHVGQRPWELRMYVYEEPGRQTRDDPRQPTGTPPTEVASQNANQHEQRERDIYQASVDYNMEQVFRRRMNDVESLLKIGVNSDQGPEWSRFSAEIINAFEDHFGIGSSRLLGDILQGCTTDMVSDDERRGTIHEGLKKMVSQKWKEQWKSSETVTLTHDELKEWFAPDDLKKLQ
jgi:hypothetical protein